MNLCVYGLWHLGSVTAACLASLGHNVTGLDSNNKNIKNGFIHTDLWDFFLPGYNKIYPIAYEIIELIVHANMGCSYSEIEKLAHSKPAIGCITDMCNYKSEINIKIRSKYKKKQIIEYTLL